MAEIVDSGKVIASGSAATFSNTITKDDATYNLTGKTVVATIRSETDDRSVVDASLEDIAVTNSGIVGAVSFALTEAMGLKLAGPRRGEADSVENYLVQYHVTTDSYYPQLLRFGVRRALD